MPTPRLHDIEQLQEASCEVRPRLLLIAYQCMPDRGPEARAGWERALQAAREFEVHAIVSAESLAAIERFQQATAVPANLRFHSPREDDLFGLLRRVPGLMQRKAFAYRQWQRIAYRLARDLHRDHGFALVHQVSLSTFREPGYAWRLGIPFVWGPVTGTEDLPAEFLTELPFAEQARERLHALGNQLSLRRRRVRLAARHASVLLAANGKVRHDLERAFQRPVELLPQNALRSTSRPDAVKFLVRGPLHILWSGELTTRNALPLLLEAVANLGYEVDYKLHVLGRGPIETQCKALAAELGLVRRCTFFSDHRLADTIEQFEWAHLFVSTGLGNSSDAVLLEALGHGIPVMCFDHHGAGDIVTPACGIKIPVTHPGHAIAAIASSLRSLAQERDRLLQLSIGAGERAREYLWPESAARISCIYRRTILAGRSARTSV